MVTSMFAPWTGTKPTKIRSLKYSICPARPQPNGQTITNQPFYLYKVLVIGVMVYRLNWFGVKYRNSTQNNINLPQKIKNTVLIIPGFLQGTEM